MDDYGQTLPGSVLVGDSPPEISASEGDETTRADAPTAAERTPALASILRRSLDDARGNPDIRERLVRLAQDAGRVDALVRTLGARHAVVRDLSRLVPRPAAAPAGRRRSSGSGPEADLVSAP